MIDPQTYSGSVNNGQATPRTAGYMPVIGQQNSAGTQNFAQMVNDAGGNNQASGAANSAGSSNGQHHGFLDFLTTLFDIINPLEHLPVISTIYEHLTGHHMNPVARIAGDTLYGGPIGTAVGVANVISEKKTGKDLGENMVAMLSGHKGRQTSDTMVAQNDVKPDIIWNDAKQAPAPAQDPSTLLAQAAQSGAELSAVAPAAGFMTPATALAASPSAPPPTQPAAPAAAASPAPALAARSPLKQNFLSLAAQQSHGATMTGKTLADYTAAARPLPASYVKDRTPAAPDAQESTPSARQAGSTPGPSVQDAPADAQERVIPPGLIAQRMMEGLDKYAALKKAQEAPGYSGTF